MSTKKIVLQSIGGAAPRTNIEHTTGIFLAMNVAYFNVASSAMTVLLNQENYPAPQPNPDQKSRFIKDVLKYDDFVINSLLKDRYPPVLVMPVYH